MLMRSDGLNNSTANAFDLISSVIAWYIILSHYGRVRTKRVVYKRRVCALLRYARFSEYTHTTGFEAARDRITISVFGNSDARTLRKGLAACINRMCANARYRARSDRVSRLKHVTRFFFFFFSLHPAPLTLLVGVPRHDRSADPETTVSTEKTLLVPSGVDAENVRLPWS